MAIARLEIEITSDVDDSVDGINDVSKSAKNMGNTIKVVLPNLDKIEKLLEEISDSSKKSADSLNKVVAAIGKAGAAAEGAAEDVDKLDENSDNASAGLSGLGKEAALTEKSVGLLTKAFTFGLGFATSFLTTAVSDLIDEYGDLGSAIKALNPFLSDHERTLLKINAAREAGLANAQEELSRIESLYRATQNLTIPLKERKKLVDELQKAYPEYFKGLTDEAILAGKAADQYNRLRDAVIAQAQAKAIQEDIEGLAREYNKVGKLIRSLNDAISNNDTKTPTFLDPKQTKAQIASLTKARDQAKQEQEKILKQQEEFFAEQQELVKKFGAEVLIDPSNKGETIKDIRTVADVLKDLKAALDATDLQAKTFGITTDNLAKEKLASLNKAFNEVVKIGGTTSPALKDIEKQISLLSASVIDDVPIATKQLQYLGNQIEFVDKKASAANGLKSLFGDQGKSALPTTRANPFLQQIERIKPALTSVDVEFKKFQDKAAAFGSSSAAAFANKFIVIGDLVKSGLGTVVIDLQSQLAGLAAGVASAIAESIGNLVSGKGGLAEVLGSLVGIMGDFIVQFGKTLIEAATLRIIAEKTLVTNPYVALAAGAAAVVIGTALKKFIPSFATGGTVFGTQLAIVGDNPQRKEHILNDSQLEDIAGGARWDGGELVGVLRGQDLLVSVERASRNQRRARG